VHLRNPTTLTTPTVQETASELIMLGPGQVEVRGEGEAPRVPLGDLETPGDPTNVARVTVDLLPTGLDTPTSVARHLWSR
jgi:hypothetical protein